METLQPAYEFHRANCAITRSPDVPKDTVLLTLNKGDNVLLESVQSNGWALGIALNSGARGWIPSNYCERHAPELIRDLLKILSCSLSLCNNEYMVRTQVHLQQNCKMIAFEIRCFLDNGHCLRRESALVLANECIRQCRKRILTNLSRLAKSVERLASSPQTTLSAQLDDVRTMLLKIATSAFDTVDVLKNIASSEARCPMQQPTEAPSLLPTDESTGTDGRIAGQQDTKRVFTQELLHNKEGQIAGGTLRAHVERLTDDSLSCQILAPIFFHTFRFFTSSIVLAKTLIQRFDTAAEDPYVVVPARELVIEIFEKWFGLYWDGSDHEALPVIELFTQEKLSRVLPAAGHNLLGLARAFQSPPAPPTHSNPPASNEDVPAADSFPHWMNDDKRLQITDFDPMEFAQQLAIMTMKIFCSIRPEELLESKWTLRSSSPKATNVAAMLALSMDMGKLVAETILEHSSDDQKHITAHWIKIALKCFELGDYASLMSIVSSIRSLFPVRYNRSLQNLFELLDPDKQYAVLRQVIHDHELPCVPAIGIYVIHLNFVRKQNLGAGELMDYHSEGMHFIDFQSARIIHQLQRFQTPYQFIEIPEIQMWIQTLISSINAGQDRRADCREEMFPSQPEKACV